MSSEKLQVVFAPGCFDNFEGTQQELDDLMVEITNNFSSISPEQINETTDMICHEEDDDFDEEFEQIEFKKEASPRLLH